VRNDKAKYDHRKTLEACDTYTNGVFAVLALINEARWDPEKRVLRSDVKFEVGRRMTTSDKNRVSPSREVSPDSVIQTGPRIGMVVEAKLSLARDTDTWDRDIKQLEKYDDDLIGWWTTDEIADGHDVVALVPLERAVKFSDRIEEGQKIDKWKFDRPLAIVGFFKKSGAEKDFLTLKKERGQLSHRSLDDKLRESVPIGFEVLIQEYQDRKFVDHEPPLPYLLQVMWDYLFTRYAAEVPPRADQNYIPLQVRTKKVTEDLQEFFGFRSSGPRSPEIPRHKWVSRALDALVQFGMAEHRGNESYVIRYKRSRKDVLEKFGRLWFLAEQKRKAQAAEGALPLFSFPGEQA
jgi:hypothetical protein